MRVPGVSRSVTKASVIDCLPRSAAAVDANLHALDALLLRELLANLPYEGEQRSPFVSPEILKRVRGVGAGPPADGLDRNASENATATSQS
jgi:hypothetical protein